MIGFRRYLREDLPIHPFALKRNSDYDLIVVGGGPGGLTAAINGASEKLKVLLIDGKAQLGGQARESWAIENYPGFPGGATGQDLFDKFSHQAGKFNTDLLVHTLATKIDKLGNGIVVSCSNGDKFYAPSVILATGLSHNPLPPALQEYIGRGVFYGMPNEALSNLHFHNAAVVGGGNSAGQAVLHLAERKGSHVYLIIRGDVASKMSDYLLTRIKAKKNITILEKSEIDRIQGDKKLSAIKLKDSRVMAMDSIFTYIGARPSTDWLKGKIDLDERGFIKAPVTDTPIPYQTSMPGVFAIGDNRAGSTKRISAAVGEGSASIQMVHAYFAKNPQIHAYQRLPEQPIPVPHNPVETGPCRYPWQKAADGSKCGQRASVTPVKRFMPSSIRVPA